MNTRSSRPRSRSIRRGVATLEFAMSLPMLLLLFVGIVWLGFSVIGQSEVTISARNNAWRQRHPETGSGASSTPLSFTASEPVEGNDDASVSVSPVFDGLPQPSSSHAVAGGGSWDHKEIKFDQPPNWSMYQEVAGKSSAGTIPDLSLGMFGIPDGEEKIAEIAQNTIKEKLRKVEEMKDGDVEKEVQAAWDELKRLTDPKGFFGFP